MKKLYTLLIVCAVLIPTNIFGQEQEKKKEKSVSIIVIDEEDEKATIGFPNAKVEVDEKNDTITRITLGNKLIEFIEKDNKTDVRMVNVPRVKFKGHFAGAYLGFCNYTGEGHSSSLQDGANFMELNSGKSMAFSLNLLQYDLGIQKHKKNLGFVTGIGWTIYNYRMDNQFMVQLDANSKTVGVPVPEANVEKNKIVASYINIPLMFEAQIPSEDRRADAFISAGIYGGFKIGSHTKTVYEGGDKSKSRDDINLNPIQYGAMVQVGVKMIKLYATYNFSTLFEKNNGPELYPYTVGIILANF